MAKLKVGQTYVAFHCPGCECGHRIPIAQTSPEALAWGWNGSVDAPTFIPSINFDEGGPRCCHSVVTDGTIMFCPDSKHKLAGQTVELPEWE